MWPFDITFLINQSGHQSTEKLNESIEKSHTSDPIQHKYNKYTNNHVLYAQSKYANHIKMITHDEHFKMETNKTYENGRTATKLWDVDGKKEPYIK